MTGKALKFAVGLLYGTLLLIAITSFVDWRLNSNTRPTPQPSAVSPPSPPSGLAPPSHIIFTTLPIISDYVAIALATNRLGAKICSSPDLQLDLHEKAKQAVTNMEVPFLALQSNLWDDDSNSTAYIPEIRRFRKALSRAHDLCSAVRSALRETGNDFTSGPFHGWRWHARNAMTSISWQMENLIEGKRWVFQPDEEDQGQYDEFTPVGDINFIEAANLNHSAFPFLEKLESEHLLELLPLRNFWEHTGLDGVEHMERLRNKLNELVEGIGELSRTNWVVEASLSLAEEALLEPQQPSLLRRAFHWTLRRDWQQACDSRSPDEWMSKDNYYHATRWRCILEARRILETEVLPGLRQSRKDMDDALAFYYEAIEMPGKKLQSQTRELLAGRGWELVEAVQIGLTARRHWVEVQQPGEQGSRKAIAPLRAVQNVTAWRRMVLPLDPRTGDMLETMREALK